MLNLSAVFRGMQHLEEHYTVTGWSQAWQSMCKPTSDSPTVPNSRARNPGIAAACEANGLGTNMCCSSCSNESIKCGHYLAREEGPLGDVVAVPGPSIYSCSAVLCSEGLSCAAASQRADLGGGEGEGELCDQTACEQHAVMQQKISCYAVAW